jgi:signal peptidase I
MQTPTFEALRDLARGEDVTLRVRGDCMEPLFRDGDSVTVRARRAYLPGDVVVFRRRGGDLAAHRVLGLRRVEGMPALVTRGDRCVEHDAPVPFDEIIGAIQLPVAISTRIVAVSRFVTILLRRLFR